MTFPPGLTAQQAAGLACTECNTPYNFPGAPPHVPVGFAAAEDGGGQVFACASSCAADAGYTPPAQLQIGAGR